MPAERALPFLLVSEAFTDGATLIAPFRKRKGGLSPDEAVQVRSVAGRLRGLPPPGEAAWIDPNTGSATAASIGDGQLRRRLVDCASVSLMLRAR